MTRKTSFVALALSLAGAAWADPPKGWQQTDTMALQGSDDDVARHAGQPEFFAGLAVSTLRFSENGFAWELIRWSNPAKPNGPLWVVPHDDEDGAFDAMIEALKTYGGVGIAVNSSGARRIQAGHGRCGVRTGSAFGCDPNRNFAPSSPLYVEAFLEQRPAGQPVIAFHTNKSGFANDGHGGTGDITVLDAAAYRYGLTAPRPWAQFAKAPATDMANYDTFALAPFAARNARPSEADRRCERSLVQNGISFWHERVALSDGSLSNYLVLYWPEIPYFNAESRAEINPSIAVNRHGKIVAALVRNCFATPSPTTASSSLSPAATRRMQ